MYIQFFPRCHQYLYWGTGEHMQVFRSGSYYIAQVLAYVQSYLPTSMCSKYVFSSCANKTPSAKPSVWCESNFSPSTYKLHVLQYIPTCNLCQMYSSTSTYNFLCRVPSLISVRC